MKIRDGMFTVASGSQGRFGLLQRQAFARENFFLLLPSAEDRAKKKFSRPVHHIATVHSLSRMFLILIAFFLSMNYVLTMNCYAQSISSTELIEKAKEYNNQVVEYQGEVVGDVMARGEFAWINVNDGKSAIGIWGRKAIINNLVNRKGTYNCKGDIVWVNGVFHRACPEHGGDLDIHIDEIKKIKEGVLTHHPVDISKVATAFGLSIIALGLSILYAFKAGIKPWKKK